MEPLSPTISLYRPTTPPTKTDPAAPKLILLASWTAAQDPHIAKYITKYQSLYPSSQILLIKSPYAQIFSPTTIPAAVAPAVPVLKALNLSSETPELLIHLFSNGGSSSISGLYEAYAPEIVPAHVTILDSAPSETNISGSVAFFSVGWSAVQRVLLLPVIYLVATTASVAIAVGARTDWMKAWGDSHNDRGKNREVRRVYMYSEGDELVSFRFVEAHAKHAEEKGFAVRLERFEGTPHVAHARGASEERYWGLVRAAWEGGN
ncbi:hypothetical protein B0T16DRAFT_334240 [Cercophora newfieldiana]|uniref:Indole-diterpene biosynthesis protein PaxU n=1 Tax=Cercophora newfieldiana TaxID=92897 RepID=A0AA40CK01_9PEZI|nr:hypothetical protein B0T16DRAFT_334240 [Cercophora newfieldiana]